MIPARPDSSVVRRHVFYIGGFFTGGPPFYRGTLARELERHGALHGIEISIEDDPEGNALAPRYRLEAHRAEGVVEARYTLLRWEDIVLDAFARPWSWRLPAAAATLFDYLRQGIVASLFRLARRFALIWLFPFVYYALVGIGSALAGAAVMSATVRLGLEPVPGFLAGFAAGGFLLVAAGRLGRTSYAYLFLNDFIVNRAIALDRMPEMWARIDAFAAEVADRMDQHPAEEIVVVGHSFGASLAPLVAARAAALRGEEAFRLTLLTLGGSLALIGLHPAARRFREEVREAASLTGVTWIDLSSSYDAVTVKRFDPVTRFRLGEGARSPRLLDTRFGRSMSGARGGKLGLMRLHMQYIMAARSADAPYDYIGAITGVPPVSQAFGTADPG